MWRHPVWDYGSLTIPHSIVSNNTSYILGGGIFFQLSNETLSLTDVDILGNTVTNSGAGGLSLLNIQGSLIANNTGRFGCGVYITDYDMNTVINIDNSTISGNLASAGDAE